ncbi:agmatinase [Candidatus Woesearchaeota archaeon]|nr:agmatinase [Candidatus Woesearchaeota archaeon]
MPTKITNLLNFGDLPKGYYGKESPIVILPVPYDGTSTWGKGADKGPDAIIEASANMELYDIETDSEVYKKGIFTDTPVKEASSPEKMADAVYARVKEHLNNNKFVVLLGGEHSVTIGCAKAYAEHFKSNGKKDANAKDANTNEFSVLQLDAHSDMRQEYQDSKFNHACVMARVQEMCPIVQVGIRSMDVSEKKYLKKENVFFAKDIHANKETANDWIEQVVSKLGKKVYITIDLDVFDPSIMPSTGTPEPGGLWWYDVLALMKKIFENREVVGFDVVELAPNKQNKGPDFLATKLVYSMLSYKFK